MGLPSSQTLVQKLPAHLAEHPLPKGSLWRAVTLDTAARSCAAKFAALMAERPRAQGANPRLCPSRLGVSHPRADPAAPLRRRGASTCMRAAATAVRRRWPPAALGVRASGRAHGRLLHQPRAARVQRRHLPVPGRGRVAAERGTRRGRRRAFPLQGHGSPGGRAPTPPARSAQARFAHAWSAPAGALGTPPLGRSGQTQLAA